jgi:uncharacterized membrane protein
MKRQSTIFLRVVLSLLGATVLGICIFVLPGIIGSIELGGYDPILLGMYIPAIPFLIALYQAWKLLNYIDQNKAFSHTSVATLKNIKYCGIAIAALYAVGMPYIFHVADKDDAPGVVAIGLVIIGASIVIATFAEVLKKLLQDALEIKSENDLTV